MPIPVEIEFWWYFIVIAVKDGGERLAKRVWGLLFDFREFAWRSSRAVDAWITWGPRFGFSFDINLSFIPGHKADPDDEYDSGYGPELRVGFGLGWVDGGLTIPNDNHPDNLLEAPTHYCACGAETRPRIAHFCTGCDEVDCTCELAEPGPPLFG